MEKFNLNEKTETTASDSSMGANKLLSLPLYYDEGSQMIFDQRGIVLDVRMWGRLTGTGAMNLPSSEAMKIQDDFGRQIVNILNDSFTPPSSAPSQPSEQKPKGLDFEYLGKELEKFLASQTKEDFERWLAMDKERMKPTEEDKQSSDDAYEEMLKFEASEKDISKGVEEEFKNQLKVLFKLKPEDIQALNQIILEAKKQEREKAIQECIESIIKLGEQESEIWTEVEHPLGKVADELEKLKTP